MGRIRTVKPELFIHDELYDVEEVSGLPVRLAYIGLFTVADREGRFIWRPRQLKAQLFPYDDLDFSTVLNALAKAGFLTHYKVNSKEYGVINSFTNHQQINSKEAQSKLPALVDGEEIAENPPLNESTSPVPDVHMSSDELPSPVKGANENSNGEGKGREGKGTRKGKEGVVSNDTCPAIAEPTSNRAAQVQEIFSHWQTVLGHSNAKLDSKRKRDIEQGLKSGYAVDQLKLAIDGCSRTPHNTGDNERNQRYDGINVIFRNADQIDRFIRNAGQPAVPQMSKAGRSTQAAAAQVMSEMFGENHGH